MNHQVQIEKIKRDFQAKLEKNSPRYRRAIIRELDFLYRKHGKGDLQAFLESIQKYFDIPVTEKALTIEVFRQSQAEISQLWDEYFRESTDLFDSADPNTFEKLQALYKVDFSKIKSDAGAIITEEIRRSARAGQGYEVLRSRLLKRSFGESQVRTLANTALAQFDNATMIEYAQQGGVEKFKYDGVLHTNTRPFCREHLGKQYTLQQIRSMDNGQGIPVETSCGGYNCTHFWTPVITELSKQKRQKKQKPAIEGKIPVSNALNVVAGGPLGTEIRRTIKFIDDVHLDGELSNIPVRHTARRDIHGAMMSLLHPDGRQEPKEIMIALSRHHPHITTAHEIGHLIDLDAIGSKGYFGTEGASEEAKKVVEVMKQTRRILELQSTLNQTSLRSHRGYINYLLTNKETWARAYSQYVALRSKSPEMKDELKKMMDADIVKAQWDDDDFVPVAEAIDNLFTTLGWR